MRPWIKRLLPVLLCLSAPVLAGDKPPLPAETLESVMTMQVDGRIDLDAKGSLVAFKVETQVPDVLRQKLERMVGAWHFTPAPSADGIARPISSPMRLTLAATKVDEGYRVKIDNVIFPPEGKPVGATGSAGVPDTGITGRSMFPPRYPRGLDRVSGVVLLSVLLGAEGKVIEATSVQSKLINVSGSKGRMAQALREFERESLAAARGWQFNVPAALAQAPANSRTVNVPVTFNGWDDNNGKVSVSVPAPGTWRYEVRTPIREIGWLPTTPGRQRMGVSDLADGEVMPVVGLVKLDTDVIGMEVM